MGVNLTFATTLARAAPDQGGPEAGNFNSGGEDVPIILGSSQAQVVSAQDGTASIAPSTGTVGPCDVFITASAGQLNAQFEMESVAAIVPAPPQNAGARTAAMPHHSRIEPSPAGAMPGAVSTPEALFSVPEGLAAEAPAFDPSECHASVDDASSYPEGVSAGSAPGDRTEPPVCAGSAPMPMPSKANPVEIEARAPVTQTEAIKIASAASAVTTPQPAKGANSAAADRTVPVDCGLTGWEQRVEPGFGVTNARDDPSSSGRASSLPCDLPVIGPGADTSITFADHKRSCQALAEDRVFP
jgi:hypothetical protein